MSGGRASAASRSAGLPSRRWRRSPARAADHARRRWRRPASTTATERASSASYAITSRWRGVRGERALSARQSASSSDDLPAPFDPQTKVSRGAIATVSGARLRIPLVVSDATTGFGAEAFAAGSPSRSIGHGRGVQTFSRIGITR